VSGSVSQSSRRACEFLRASCDDVDVEACVGKAVGGIAGEDGLVVVIALCGFAESEV